LSALFPNPIPAADARRVECKYDYQKRRVQKTVLKRNPGNTAWVTDTDEKFIYHGWNQIAALQLVSSQWSVVRSSYWGLDWSGTLQGAGGVGGLLLTQEGGNTYLPIYDGNGNVMGMVKASTGSVDAAYEYDAFGNTLRESGPYAASNPFRFSTKYTDIETGLVYYGLRYYSPSLGRFLNKDPIEEQGGLNLYAFCGNNGVNRWDYLGMWPLIAGPSIGVEFPRIPISPWASNSFGVVAGGLQMSVGVSILGTPFAPIGILFIAQGGAQLMVSVGNLNLLSTGDTNAGLINNGGVFSLVNASVNTWSGAGVNTDANTFAWVDFGVNRVTGGVPGFPATNWTNARGLPENLAPVEDVINVVETTQPFVTALPDGVVAADSTIYSTPSEAEVRGDRFHIPNVPSLGDNNFSGGLYSAMYGFSLRGSGFRGTPGTNGTGTPGVYHLTPMKVIPQTGQGAAPAGNTGNNSNSNSDSSAPPPSIGSLNYSITDPEAIAAFMNSAGRPKVDRLGNRLK